MTVKVSVDPGSHPARVYVLDDDGSDINDYHVPAGSVRSFHVTPGRAIRIEEVKGSNDRIDRPEPAANGASPGDPLGQRDMPEYDNEPPKPLDGDI